MVDPSLWGSTVDPARTNYTPPYTTLLSGKQDLRLVEFFVVPVLANTHALLRSPSIPAKGFARSHFLSRARLPTMHLTFWGAAQTVTGSMHQLTVSGHSYLLDCGLYQGSRTRAFEINRNLPFDPEDIRAVVLSHAHIDHSGNLPTLSKRGFHGHIYATPATRDLCKFMLADSAHLQVKDAEFIERRSARRRSLGVRDAARAVPPLYQPEDVDRVMNTFRQVRYRKELEIGPGVAITMRNAGHMLGSAHVSLRLTEGGTSRQVLFSGDIGRVRLPILKDPDPAPAADYLILESTYGDRFHHPASEVEDKLVEIIHRVTARGGHIVAPAFAVGRTQQLVLLLHELTQAGRIPELPIFVDSPLAVNVTEVFRDHPEEYDDETYDFVENGKDPFGFGRLRYLRTPQESKTLNDLRVPFLVISASGMAEAGRVLHHLRHSIEDPRNLVLLTGYQAEHTLGRKLQERRPQVPIFGEPVTLRAEVESIGELSGHADQRELLEWVRPIAPSLRRIFLVHGEPAAQHVLKEKLEQEFRVPVEVPARGDQFQLD